MPTELAYVLPKSLLNNAYKASLLFLYPSETLKILTPFAIAVKDFFGRFFGSLAALCVPSGGQGSADSPHLLKQAPVVHSGGHMW